MLRSYRYEEIAEDLRQQIQQGRYQEGARLPAERVLLQKYGVQRNTIRQALTLLQQEGWLHVRPRSGVFVAPLNEHANNRNAPPPTVNGVILVVNAWNRSSTAMDSVLAGLEVALKNTTLTLQRFNSQARPGSGGHIVPTLEYLQENNVVGVILWPQSPTNTEALGKIRAAVPLVLIDRRVSGFECDCVHFDNVLGGQVVTEHLISQGHRSIGFLCDEVFAETVQQRWRGYTLGLEAGGLTIDSNKFALFEGIQESTFSLYARQLLKGGDAPLTAVVCSNDGVALLLLRFLRSEGYRVPEDIAVSGYGNLLPHYLDTLELTTVAQPFDEVGRVAGELLLDRLQNHTYPLPSGEFRDVQLPVHLIVRNSTLSRIPGEKI